MAQTPIPGGSYLLPADILVRYDARTIGELLVDDDQAPRLTPTEILVSTSLNLLCLEACGELESALLRGRRQDPTDIQAIVDAGGSQAQYVKGILSALVMARLLGRRPDRFPTPDSVKEARVIIDQLADGLRILPTNETADAGMKVPPIQLPISNFPLITQTARRYFGPMNRPQLGGLD